MTLIINLRTSDIGLELQGFPFGVDQHIEHETLNGTDVLVAIDLAGANDTTVAQEQYLNTNRAVVNYEVLP